MSFYPGTITTRSNYKTVGRGSIARVFFATILYNTEYIKGALRLSSESRTPVYIAGLKDKDVRLCVLTPQ